MYIFINSKAYRNNFPRLVYLTISDQNPQIKTQYLLNRIHNVIFDFT